MTTHMWLHSHWLLSWVASHSRLASVWHHGSRMALIGNGRRRLVNIHRLSNVLVVSNLLLLQLLVHLGVRWRHHGGWDLHGNLFWGLCGLAVILDSHLDLA